MLSRRAQVYLANGRFIGASGGPAQFALPDRGAVERAASFVPEAEDALAAHFGRRVTLRLVVDDGTVAAKPGSATSSGDDETYDLDDLDHFTDAPPPVPVEQRIMEAFPGSVLEA